MTCQGIGDAATVEINVARTTEMAIIVFMMISL
jgi:hypothetical protein